MQLTPLFVLLAGCGIAACFGSRICEPGLGMSPFDEQQFSGDWHIVGLGISDGPTIPLDCGQARYNATDHGNVTRFDISIRLKDEDTYYTVLVKGQTFLSGSKSVTQAVTKLGTVHISGGQASTDWEKGVMEFAVLATDYQQFAVIHSCHLNYDPNADSFIRTANYHIWSRTPTLDPVVWNTLKIMGSAFEHGIGKYITVIPNDC